MAPAEAAGPDPLRVRVEVVYCAGRGLADRRLLDLPFGCTAGEALARSALAERHPGLDLSELGVWGRRVAADHPLRDGDRVEVYRPLQVPPMEARRTRQRQQRKTRPPRPA